MSAERLKCKYRYKQAIKVAMQDNDRAFNDDLFDHLCLEGMAEMLLLKLCQTHKYRQW